MAPENILSSTCDLRLIEELTTGLESRNWGRFFLGPQCASGRCALEGDDVTGRGGKEKNWGTAACGLELVIPKVALSRVLVQGI